MSARSRPGPGQPAAASGLSSWEQRRGSSSSGSSSVQCTLTLLPSGACRAGVGEKRAGFQPPGVCAGGARGGSLLGRPVPAPCLLLGIRVQPLTLSGTPSSSSAGEGFSVSLPCFFYLLFVKVNRSKIVLWARERSAGFVGRQKTYPSILLP